MKISEIKNKQEFIDYLYQRQLEGLKAEDDTQEEVIRLCELYDIPKSMLRMHYDIRKQK